MYSVAASKDGRILVNSFNPEGNQGIKNPDSPLNFYFESRIKGVSRLKHVFFTFVYCGTTYSMFFLDCNKR